ncbi:proton extrusion protein PcxA [Anabaena lutea]|uniref:Proton extrusion protein PxcA n=1 Tax=Anabaena lutea FACHB-196 TaxID=2692881 RepID=A0ABR8FDA5_9NOST|nr:proton extrusion protein PcxA [Anabaena lutea]MBD2567593.1 proton extrusion protein PcxA [Anabaena lutea FACHB-196]
MKLSFFAQKTQLIRQKFTEYWHLFNQWFINTPERAILDAYQAAEAIQKIEIEQFNGQKISPELANYTENVMSYWQGNLNRNLTTIKVRLAEFNLGSTFINTSDSSILEKLKFIDEVIARYTPRDGSIFEPLPINPNPVQKLSNLPDKDVTNSAPTIQKTGVIPRSIGITINKITQDFAPKAEEEFVKKYRISRNRTRRAIKFLLLLIIVPLLTQHFSKILLIHPLVENFRIENKTQIFLNSEMEEAALKELTNFEKQLKFESLLLPAPEILPEKIEAKLKNKVREIAAEFTYKSSNAISNVFADVISLVAFAIVIAFSKKDIIFVKYFLDQIIYGLSDSAKAFLIILFTDIFVGFHSPHGWEILLEAVAEHLGLPASRNGIFLFIATFPVILNTIFKYWIFRYLSRLSPSALATLKEMDE